MPSIMQEVGETFATLYKGFSVTLKTMFRKTTTERFPEAPATVEPRYRGIHVLQRVFDTGSSGRNLISYSSTPDHPVTIVPTRATPRIEWSDAKIINTGIRLIEKLLKPFERFDPQRFHRLAVGIAKGIAGDYLQDDESTLFGS